MLRVWPAMMAPVRGLYFGWWVALASSAVAVFSWGLAFYGLGVYLPFLEDAHGWSAAGISGAFTVYHLAGVVTMLVIGPLIDERGAGVVMLAGAVLMAVGAALIGVVTELWQLYAVFLVVMPLAWACLGPVAISAAVGPWFQERRGTAMTIALTGPSFGGMLVVPALVQGGESLGFTATLLIAALCTLVAVGVLAVAVIGRSPPVSPTAVEEVGAPGGDGEAVSGPEARWSRRDALGSLAFWTLAIPFPLALAVQVGFLVHQIAFLEVALGRSEAGFVVSVTTAAALAGRFAPGLLADRMSMRTLSAAIVAVQAGGFVLLATLPETRWALYGGSIAVGLGVGNLITLPALIAQAEFGLASFGKLYGMVAAANQLGVGVAAIGVAALRDVLGGYEAAWIALALLEVVAIAIMWPAWLRLMRRPSARPI